MRWPSTDRPPSVRRRRPNLETLTMSTQPPDESPTPGSTSPRPSRRQRGRLEDYRVERRRAVRYRIAVIVTATLSWITWFTPAFLRYRIADLFGDLFFRMGPGYRANLIDNQRHLRPGAGDEALLQSALSASRTSSRNFADLLLVPRVDRIRSVTRDPLIEGEWRYLDDALALGKGVIFLTAHLGPFDTLLHHLHHRGYRITAVTGRTTSRFVFDGVTWLRRFDNLDVVEASPSGVRRIYRALKRGECAAFLSDFDFFQSGREVTFFGSPTSLPQGAIRIARDTGAPIVPIFARRIGHRNCLIIHEAFMIDKTKDLEADVERGLRLATAALERAIGSTPDQWVMFQRVWPSEPASPAPAVPDGAAPGGAPSARSGA